MYVLYSTTLPAIASRSGEAGGAFGYCILSGLDMAHHCHILMGGSQFLQQRERYSFFMLSFRQREERKATTAEPKSKRKACL